MSFLIATFHEIAIKYESDLKTQLVFLDISTIKWGHRTLNDLSI